MNNTPAKLFALNKATMQARAASGLDIGASVKSALFMFSINTTQNRKSKTINYGSATTIDEMIETMRDITQCITGTRPPLATTTSPLNLFGIEATQRTH